MLSELYRPPLALLTDLYQLTMAYGYWKLGRHQEEAVFHLFFRRAPFGGEYAITAGLAQAVEYIQAYRFDESDIEYLASLTGNDHQALFEPGFLDYLSNMKLEVDVDAMPEGTLAFGAQPLLRIRGPILQCQLLETPLLNIINFQTLIATKAARIAGAACGEPVLEFGLRRSQGIDGSLSASRAAYIGGCAATSNVLAGKLYGIPVKGTHAHSWVMSFDTETESFARYADAMPNNCVFLVDTYDTIQGVHEAVKAGIALRDRGHEMVGIRLDSGDLAYLSIEARRILDEAGFENAAIVASNDLDEHIIESLKLQDAKITVWGVGTKLVTAYDQPALGGVYKLGALRDQQGVWQPKVKLSEQQIKTSIPGILQVRRFERDGQMIGDIIYDQSTGEEPTLEIVDIKDSTRRKRFDADTPATELLVPTMRNGAPTGPPEDLIIIRSRATDGLAKLHPTSRRLLNPHEYPVGLDSKLHQVRADMIEIARKKP